MSETAIAAIIVLVILLIYYLWSYRQKEDPTEEQFRIARYKLNRARAYDGYQNHLLDKCQTCIGGKHTQFITSADQAKLISLREMSKTVTQHVNDLDGALVTIRSMQSAPERVVVINSALDKLWMLQCDQNQQLMRLKSFQFLYPRKQW
jgi:hypothetical protein